MDEMKRQVKIYRRTVDIDIDGYKTDIEQIYRYEILDENDKIIYEWNIG